MADAPAEKLSILMKRWADQEARFELLRPTRRHPLGFGLSLQELRDLRQAIDLAEAMLAAEPHRPNYEVTDLKASLRARSEAA